MRITQNTVVRGYISNLERNYAAKNASENKIASNRSFNRASENPVNAAKALKVRKALANLETYEGNLETATSIYETAESAVMSVSKLMQSTYERLIYGANGTQNDDENEIIANEIETYADEMTRLMNVTVADRKIFGGTNNTSNCYTIETSNLGNKTVKYNGVSVNTFNDAQSFPNADYSYTDIGIGMTFDSDGRVDPQSALPVTFNGADILGCGITSTTTKLDLSAMTNGEPYKLDVTVGTTKKSIIFTAGATTADTATAINDEILTAFGTQTMSIDDEGVATALGNQDLLIENGTPTITDPTDPNYVAYGTADIERSEVGYSNNVIQLTLDAAEALRSGDKTLAARYADIIFSAQTKLSLSIADIGNREEFIEFNQERITNNIYSLDEQQNSLEGTDYGSETTNWKVLESIYNATLQMSTSVISMSIFNFMS